DRNVTGVQTCALPILIVFRGLESAVPAESRPFRATWRGELLIERTGSYELELVTDSEASLSLDGRELVRSGAEAGEAGSFRNRRSEERRVGKEGRAGW